MLLDEKIKQEAAAGRKHYVYIAKQGNKVVYVGKGKGSRYIHTVNGCSRNYKLNRYFFRAELLGTPPLQVDILKFFEFEKDALAYEEDKILELQPKCNTQSLKPKRNLKSDHLRNLIKLELRKLLLKKASLIRLHGSLELIAVLYGEVCH